MNARELTNHLVALLRTEQSAMADFLVALADFDKRGLWAELGHASLFYFLHRELALSKGAAHYRKVAAELVQRFPEIVEPLRDGRLCITGVVELAKVLTPENREEVLPRFFHRSKREAMAVAAEIRPAEVVPKRAVVTALRVEAPALTLDAPPATSPPDLGQLVQPVELLPPANEPCTAPSGPSPSAYRDVAVPLTAELSRLHVTVSGRFLEKLAAARDALSHSHPGASEEEILEAGLDLLLERHAKRKGVVAKPQKKARPSKTDAIPAHVKRAAWIRAGGRCEWRLESGERCNATTRLEFDHVEPRARGGPSTLENVRVHCRPHNIMGARRAFGDQLMDRYTRRRDRIPAR